MKLGLIQKFPYWLIGAVLYGISWPIPWNMNLSFLAWFALVFLLISLEQAKGFWRFFGIAWGFTFVSYTICSGWFLQIPADKFLIAVGALSESFSFPLPFISYYFIKKRTGFNKSVFILPFLFVVGEWVYCSLEHNLSYLLVAHSQTANLRLIQYADLFGYLSVTFWVVLFNVLLYSALVRSGYRPFSFNFLKRAVLSVLVMLAPPLVYAGIRDRQIKEEKPDSLSIAMIHTNFSPRPDEDRSLKNLDRLVELTDSVDYYSRRNKVRQDLVVWHEGAIPLGNKAFIRSLVWKAVRDWQVPLLSGMEYYERFNGTDAWQPVNRVVLFTSHPDTADPLPFYDKMHLAPGWESIPYLSFFHQLGIRFAKEYKYHRKGDRLRLFEVPARGGKVLIGTPVCFEQNDPSLWNRMIRLGAVGFVQVSFESWFGKTYFQKQVAYITRLRAIETRHSTARCSNGGLTFFVDAFGRITSQAPSSESSITDSLALSNTVTFYTRHQNLFPWMCLVVSAGYFMIVLCRPFD